MNPLLLSGIFNIGGKILDHFFPDPAQKAAAQLELLKMQQNGELAQLAADTDLAKLQIQTNIEEAKSTNWFVAGWRPAVGWTCGVAFAYAYVVLPFVQFLAYAFGTKEMVGQLALLPKLDLGGMMPVLLGMLGLGALRTVEKTQGVEEHK
jgi:hypothetical protein